MSVHTTEASMSQRDNVSRGLVKLIDFHEFYIKPEWEVIQGNIKVCYANLMTAPTDVWNLNPILKQLAVLDWVKEMKEEGADILLFVEGKKVEKMNDAPTLKVYDEYGELVTVASRHFMKEFRDTALEIGYRFISVAYNDTPFAAHYFLLIREDKVYNAKIEPVVFGIDGYEQVYRLNSTFSHDDASARRVATLSFNVRGCYEKFICTVAHGYVVDGTLKTMYMEMAALQQMFYKMLYQLMGFHVIVWLQGDYNSYRDQNGNATMDPLTHKGFHLIDPSPPYKVGKGATKPEIEGSIIVGGYDRNYELLANKYGKPSDLDHIYALTTQMDPRYHFHAYTRNPVYTTRDITTQRYRDSLQKNIEKLGKEFPVNKEYGLIPWQKLSEDGKTTYTLISDHMTSSFQLCGSCVLPAVIPTNNYEKQLLRHLSRPDTFAPCVSVTSAVDNASTTVSAPTTTSTAECQTETVSLTTNTSTLKYSKTDKKHVAFYPNTAAKTAQQTIRESVNVSVKDCIRKIIDHNYDMLFYDPVKGDNLTNSELADAIFAVYKRDTLPLFVSDSKYN